VQITPEVMIDESELEERFVRASGPGGQNVNKVATAVQLRFDAARSSALGAEVRERLARIAGNRMTADGILVIDARQFRTQGENRKAARERLAELVRRALERPKRRKKTKPTAASRERRVTAKKQRAETKRGRGRVAADETG
jgi:ribosome-associated protein